jgi:anti-sigma regulatory factor (Ser/Thr protein kinase)
MSADHERRPYEVRQVTLSCGSDAPSLARTALLGWLDGHANGKLCDDACLLVSELITNSVLHGSQPAGAPVQMRAAVLGGVVRVEVQDAGYGEVRRRVGDPRHGGGFGLQLLQLLADRWGVSHERGTLVWFELPLRGATPP